MRAPLLFASGLALVYFSSRDDAANGGFYPVSAIDWDALTVVLAGVLHPGQPGRVGARQLRRDPRRAADRGGARAREEGHRVHRRLGLRPSVRATGIDASVADYLAAGVPAAKLGVGAGCYGECYTSPVTGPVEALGSSQISASDGVISYRNILSTYYARSAYHYDGAAEAPYLTLSGDNAQKYTFVSYEDETSLAAKAAWVKSQGLGGVILWTLSEGYVSSGASIGAKNPLVEAMRGVF